MLYSCLFVDGTLAMPTHAHNNTVYDEQCGQPANDKPAQHKRLAANLSHKSNKKKNASNHLVWCRNIGLGMSEQVRKRKIEKKSVDLSVCFLNYFFLASSAIHFWFFTFLTWRNANTLLLWQTNVFLNLKQSEIEKKEVWICIRMD